MTSLLKGVQALGIVVAATAGFAVAGPSVPSPSPAAGAAKPGPHVKYENPDVDLGEVVRGAAGEAVFVLRNVGTEPIKVVSAHPG